MRILLRLESFTFFGPIYYVLYYIVYLLCVAHSFGVHPLQEREGRFLVGETEFSDLYVNHGSGDSTCANPGRHKTSK